MLENIEQEASELEQLHRDATAWRARLDDLPTDSVERTELERDVAAAERLVTEAEQTSWPASVQLYRERIQPTGGHETHQDQAPDHTQSTVHVGDKTDSLDRTATNREGPDPTAQYADDRQAKILHQLRGDIAQSVAEASSAVPASAAGTAERGLDIGAPMPDGPTQQRLDREPPGYGLGT